MPSKTFVEGFIKTFQRQTVLNLEHGIFFFLISSLVRNPLPYIMEQIKGNVVGWLGGSVLSFKLQPNSLRN